VGSPEPAGAAGASRMAIGAGGGSVGGLTGPG